MDQFSEHDPTCPECEGQGRMRHGVPAGNDQTAPVCGTCNGAGRVKAKKK